MVWLLLCSLLVVKIQDSLTFFVDNDVMRQFVRDMIPWEDYWVKVIEMLIHEESLVDFESVAFVAKRKIKLRIFWIYICLLYFSNSSFKWSYMISISICDRIFNKMIISFYRIILECIKIFWCIYLYERKTSENF